MSSCRPLSRRGGGNDSKRAFQHAAAGLYAASGDAPEWAGAFGVARTLNCPVPDVEQQPMFWVVAAQMYQEAEAAGNRAREAMGN